jgi:hypothetical protein
MATILRIRYRKYSVRGNSLKTIERRTSSLTPALDGPIDMRINRMLIEFVTVHLDKEIVSIKVMRHV